MVSEACPVVIVGAGPAGLTLGLSLSKLGLKSIILEKEPEITEDPRGVYLAGDAVRILYDIGLGKYMSEIGHELQEVNFHQTDFRASPFLDLQLRGDFLHQAVPTGILQIQPELEAALRREVAASDFCTLKTGCCVTEIQYHETGTISVEYEEGTSASCLHADWVVGADGKRGVVRKHFLEKRAGIQQTDSDYRYSDTWVAANLKIKVPTRETHPDLDVWDEGLSPEDVYDLFWPRNWHFCSPPGKPTACGRFGPHEARLWRHEFRQTDWNEKVMNAEDLFWEHILPMLSRPKKADGTPFAKGPIQFPRDCIEILRCRPFTFTHKVVNKWFWKRFILIGDAAHVFPPFGGQGIASGIRDAHQLAWRLSLLSSFKDSLKPDQSNYLLQTWSVERIASIKDAATVTKLNGWLCNGDKPLLTSALSWLRWIVSKLPVSEEATDPQAMAETDGFRHVKGGFSLGQFHGGRKLPQIYVDLIGSRATLSDSVFSPADSPMRLIMFVDGRACPEARIEDLRQILKQSGVSPTVLSPKSILILSTEAGCPPESIGHYADSGDVRKLCATAPNRLSKRQARSGYRISVYKERLGWHTRFVIVRPDFYVFAAVATLMDLQTACSELHKMLTG